MDFNQTVEVPETFLDHIVSLSRKKNIFATRTPVCVHLVEFLSLDTADQTEKKDPTHTNHYLRYYLGNGTDEKQGNLFQWLMYNISLVIRRLTDH